MLTVIAPVFDLGQEKVRKNMEIYIQNCVGALLMALMQPLGRRGVECAVQFTMMCAKLFFSVIDRICFEMTLIFYVSSVIMFFQS